MYQNTEELIAALNAFGGSEEILDMEYPRHGEGPVIFADLWGELSGPLSESIPQWENSH